MNFEIENAGRNKDILKTEHRKPKTDTIQVYVVRIFRHTFFRNLNFKDSKWRIGN